MPGNASGSGEDGGGPGRIVVHAHPLQQAHRAAGQDEALPALALVLVGLIPPSAVPWFRGIVMAHIEFVAIDLALDMAGRFGAEMGRDFVSDFLTVAADEAMHFALLDRHLLRPYWLLPRKQYATVVTSGFLEPERRIPLEALRAWVQQQLTPPQSG